VRHIVVDKRLGTISVDRKGPKITRRRKGQSAALLDMPTSAFFE